MKEIGVRLVIAVSLVASLWTAGHSAQAPSVAQERPDFTGYWVGVEAPERWLSITRDGSHLVVKGKGPRPPAEVFPLDDGETRTTFATSQGDAMLHISHSVWIGNALLVTTESRREGSSDRGYEDMMILSREVDTGNLTVTTLSNLIYTGPFHGMGHGTLTYVKSDRTAF